MAQTAAPTETTTSPARKAASKSSSPASADKSTTKAAAKPATTKTGSAKSAPAKPAALKRPASAKTGHATAPAGKAARTVQSRDTSTTAKEHAEHVDRVWELAKRIGICMFVTWDGERQRARPLAASVEQSERAIYFLTDVNGEKDEQIADFPIVTLAFADHAHSKYVAITGKATVSNDRARIKELWSPFAKAWWDSPDDPAIRVIKMVPQDAELWDSPGRIVTTISMLAAAVTGRSPKIGENAKVEL